MSIMKLKISTTKLVTFALLFAFFLLPAITHAQPGFGDDVDDVPLDGGLSLLVAAGVGYGVKKLKRNKK
jgi:hypothetical protein